MFLDVMRVDGQLDNGILGNHNRPILKGPKGSSFVTDGLWGWDL
jgi:hypothetical protein